MRAWLPGMFFGLTLALTATGAPPPVTAFTNYARYETIEISPTGEYLAITRRLSQNEVLTVLGVPQLKLVGETHFGDLTDIERVRWANDRRLLVQPARRFPGLTAAKVPTGEIVGINADMQGAELLFGYQAGQMQTGTRFKQRQSIDAPARLLTTIPGDPQNVLIETFGYSIEGDYNSVYRMNVNSGALVRVATSPVRDGYFIVDSDQRVALVYGWDREGLMKVFYRTRDGKEWKLIARGGNEEGAMIPVGPWNAPGEFLAMTDHDAPTVGVLAFSPETGTSRPLFRHPTVDVAGRHLDPARKPWAFVYDDHFPEYWYPDPQHPLAQAHQWLRTTFRGHQVDIESATRDMSHAIVRVTSPRYPLVFFYVDLRNRKLIEQLAAYPDLKPEDLAKVDPIEFKARDGLTIRGYLTVPNVPDKKKLPTIVMIHGGPYGIYDAWEFNAESQLFASRGYAVLQVNYRGSGGRGRKFEAAGFGEWGALMQDDITDAVRWAIGDGVTDPKRVCVYGGSYGAYSALTGAFREPELFRCAVGMAGVYDLPLMFEKGEIPTMNRGVNFLKLALGTNTEELKKRSPVYNAEKIKAAVLLLHGRDDERAPFEHARRMRAALEKAGNAPEWVSEWGEGHGFRSEKNRAEAYERILAFFAKHLGPTATPGT
jgi:dipeptidyl aminopeptidase/acylaminoacyl peptidase